MVSHVTIGTNDLARAIAFHGAYVRDPADNTLHFVRRGESS